MDRQKLRQYRAVHVLDGERSLSHVGSPPRFVFSEHFVAAGILAIANRVGCKLRDRRRVANSEIKPLRADRRQQMPGFSHERDAARAEPVSQFERKWK